MTRDDVQRWLDAYVEAWNTYDPDKIGALYAETATELYHPYDADPVEGRQAIVDNWLKYRDDPGTYTGKYEVWAVDGDRAVARGESEYRKPDGSFRTRYYNVFLMQFDGDGRCTSFTEYFMELPERLRPS